MSEETKQIELKHYEYAKVSESIGNNDWCEENGAICFSVTSDGTTGEGWIKRLKDQKICIGEYFESFLRSRRFRPTKGVTYEVVVLKANLLKDKGEEYLVWKKARKEARKRKLTKPHPEIACLIREKFRGEDMRKMDITWFVVEHSFVKDFFSAPILVDLFMDVETLTSPAYRLDHVNYELDGDSDGVVYIASKTKAPKAPKTTKTTKTTKTPKSPKTSKS